MAKPVPVWRLSLATTVTLLTFSQPGFAQEPKESEGGARYSAELGMGFEYDSNIAVEEVDASSNQSDYALTINAGVGAETDITESTEIGITYDYNQSIYQDFSQVDRQTHLLGASLNSDFDKADAGITLFYINSRLDGDAFLEMYRASPSVSGFLAKKWFARGAYVYSEKYIEDREERDADTHAVEGDVYYFRRGLRSYFNLGYRFRDEDAEADRFDFRSNSLKLRYIHRMEMFSKLAKLELAWRYEDRDYTSVTPSIGEDRSDERHRWRVDLELPMFSEGGVLQIYAGYADYESNLDSADYTQTISGMRFVQRW